MFHDGWDFKASQHSRNTETDAVSGRQKNSKSPLQFLRAVFYSYAVAFLYAGYRIPQWMPLAASTRYLLQATVMAGGQVRGSCAVTTLVEWRGRSKHVMQSLILAGFPGEKPILDKTLV